MWPVQCRCNVLTTCLVERKSKGEVRVHVVVQAQRTCAAASIRNEVSMRVSHCADVCTIWSIESEMRAESARVGNGLEMRARAAPMLAATDTLSAKSPSTSPSRLRSPDAHRGQRWCTSGAKLAMKSRKTRKWAGLRVAQKVYVSRGMWSRSNEKWLVSLGIDGNRAACVRQTCACSGIVRRTNGVLGCCIPSRLGTNPA